MTADENLRDLAKDIPFDRPTDSRRDALRSALLVEAAESSVARTPNRRWLGVGAAFAAGVLAAAAVAVIIVRRAPSSIERANLAQITASSPEARLDHRVVTTTTGVDEIVEIRHGTIALSIPAQRRGDHVRVKTPSAEVEGDAGELEVVVAHDALQSVSVKSGTARVIVVGQAPVVLSSGQTWRASIITADLSPSPTQPTPSPVEPAVAPEPLPVAIAPAPARANPRTSEAPAKKPASSGATSAPNVTAPPSGRSPAIATAPTPLPPADGVKPVAPALAPADGAKPTRVAPPMPAAPATDGTKPEFVVELVKPTKPTSIEQRFKIGWDLLRAGKAREAATELGAAADAAPESPLASDARYFQAVALVRANDPQTAERVLVQFLDTAPKSLRRGRAAILLGRLLAERGDTKSARAWLETAANDPDPAIAAAAKAGLQSLR